MTNTLHFSEWINCTRAQRKVNLCAPGAPKGPKVGMFVRQYEILCANDAGRAPRKYHGVSTKIKSTDVNHYKIASECNRLGTGVSNHAISLNAIHFQISKLKIYYSRLLTSIFFIRVENVQSFSTKDPSLVVLLQKISSAMKKHHSIILKMHLPQTLI